MQHVVEIEPDADPKPADASTVLLDRSVTGARWTLLLGALSLPLTYLTTVFLGRVGPDALGTYSLIVLFQMACMTFLVPGSEQALVRYLPRLPVQEKGRLLATYGKLPGLLLVSMLVLLLTYPKPVGVLLFGSETGPATRILPFLVFLVPVVVIFKLLAAVLQSEMDIKGMAIATKITPFLIFVGALVLFVFRPAALSGSHLPIAILAFVVIANLPSVAVAAVRSYAVVRSWTARGGSLSPAGFWAFTLFAFTGSVIAFAFGNLDLVIVSNRLGVHDLGLYKAALVSAEFVRWIPMILLQTIFPFFCNLLPQGDDGQVKRAYLRLIRYTSVLVGGIGLALVCFSVPLLRLFGEEFSASRGSLVLLSGVFTLSAITTINGALVVAAGRVGRALFNGAIAVTLQVLLSLWLVPELGALGAAVGKAAHLVCLLILDSWLVYSILRVFMPRRTLLLACANFGLMLIAWRFVTESLWQTGALGALLLLLYAGAVWRLRLISREDIGFVLRGVLGRSATTDGLPV
ncbi:MAG: polysaccharide biosynthesis C-terminal domain-containing protein [Candidatus Eisenbacteria sp.]|nr:polysaccharide biosynthesis C-terminal domain-containing protein [Candidatus Eisenbacteria bacterium]